MRASRKTIGIDLGTSGAKGLLISFPSGKVLKSASCSYPLYAKGNEAIQDPEDWVRATLEILRQLGPADAIALDGMMHSEVCLGLKKPAILWCDGRAQKESEYILRRVGWKTLREIPGNRPFAGFTAAHLLWRKNRRLTLICKDYVRYRLTGILRQEASDAISTLCWDLKKGAWSPTMMKKMGLPESLFPEACFSTDLVGNWKGIPVIAGCSDNAAAAIGVGAVEDGDTMISLGTSNVLLVTRNKPKVDPQMRVHTFPHGIPGKYYQMGCMLSGTRAFDWACKLFGVSPMDAPIANSSKGLLFAPYLVGERTPYADSGLRAAFAGISPDHKPAHFLRAVLEGTAFALRDAQEILGAKSARLTGGGAQHPAWKQIIADVLHIPLIETNTSREAAAFGAAILAAVGIGIFPSVEKACQKVIHPEKRIRPRGSYDREYRRYRKLYPAAVSLKGTE